jgi:hypothetical protein
MLETMQGRMNPHTLVFGNENQYNHYYPSVLEVKGPCKEEISMKKCAS